jgi:serine protease Do
MKNLFYLILAILTVPVCGHQAMAQPQLRKLFSESNPSVVVIKTVERKMPPVSQSGLVSLPGLGSGVLITADGKVLTAAHVVQAADYVGVEFADGQSVPAHVIASYPLADVALLQIERVPSGIAPARLGDSDKMQVGDDVFIIGAPYGLNHSLTVGHVSGRRSSNGAVGGHTKIELLQTDAAINQGNSGGPMFNMSGEVVGIVSQILTRSGGFEGLGFAISINVARKLLFEKKSFWTGVDGYMLSDETARIFNLPQPAGLLVLRVANNSPATDLGLQGGTVRANVGGEELIVGGDIILEIAGVAIAGDLSTVPVIEARLEKLQTGQPYTVKVLRLGKIVELTAYMRARL